MSTIYLVEGPNKFKAAFTDGAEAIRCSDMGNRVAGKACFDVTVLWVDQKHTSFFALTPHGSERTETFTLNSAGGNNV